MITIKKSVLTLSLLLTSYLLFSQDLASGIDEATSELEDIFESIRTFIFVLAAIVATYGAFNVYSKYQSQDQDAAKSAAKFGFGFVFLLTAGFIISAVFIN